jgi:hypothetical protein
MEDMTKEELIAMFHKVRTQTMQIAKEKKQAVESLEVCTKEKEDIRSKALVIIQRCKDLEEKQAANSVFKAKCESYAILFEEQTQKINDYESRLEEKTNALRHLENIISRSPEVALVLHSFLLYFMYMTILFCSSMPQLRLARSTEMLTSKAIKTGLVL